MSATWYINNDSLEPLNTPENALFVEPLPPLYTISDNQLNPPNTPENALFVEPLPNSTYDLEETSLNPPNTPENALFVEPLPDSLWKWHDYDLVPHYLAMEEFGAFCHTPNLTLIEMTPDVLSLGEYCFTNSGIEEITINENCTYFTSTFPQNCTIYHFPNT